MTDPRPVRCAECNREIGYADTRDASHALFIEHCAEAHPAAVALMITAYQQSERDAGLRAKGLPTTTAKTLHRLDR